MNKKQRGLISKLADTLTVRQLQKESRANSSHNSETIYRKKIKKYRNSLEGNITKAWIDQLNQNFTHQN